MNNQNFFSHAKKQFEEIFDYLFPRRKEIKEELEKILEFIQKERHVEREQ